MINTCLPPPPTSSLNEFFYLLLLILSQSASFRKADGGRPRESCFQNFLPLPPKVKFCHSHSNPENATGSKPPICQTSDSQQVMMDNVIDTLNFHGPENAQPASSTVTNWQIVTLRKPMGYYLVKRF